MRSARSPGLDVAWGIDPVHGAAQVDDAVVQLVRDARQVGVDARRPTLRPQCPHSHTGRKDPLDDSVVEIAADAGPFIE
jgi:hypothetical protein